MVDTKREARFRVLDHVTNLVDAVIRIDRNDARAKRVERVVVKKELRSLLEQHRDAVAESVAGLRKDTFLLFHRCQCFAPGHFPPVRVVSTARHRRDCISRTVAIFFRRTLQRVVQGSVS